MNPSFILELFLHIDRWLAQMVAVYGDWLYGIVSLILFAETGITFLPFLPGDSMLFAVGTLAASGKLSFWILYITLSAAAILGDVVNYHMGKWFGLWFVKRKFVNLRSMEKAKQFAITHGGKAIVLARFIPILRTFVPFVAGLSYMPFKSFLFYNVTGGLLWITTFVGGGYFFGKIPFVKENFSLVVIAIVVLSIAIPVFKTGWTYFNHRSKTV